MRDLGSSFREYGPWGRILKACDNYRMRKLSNVQYRMQLRNLILWISRKYFTSCMRYAMRYLGSREYGPDNL